MIHIERVHILDSIYDSIKFQIILKRFIDDIPLTDTDIEILSIFYVHGITDIAKDMIISKKIYKNMQSVENTLSKFTRMGIIKKDNGGKVFTDRLEVETDPSSILMTIKIGNK
jgi:hypothetical protein